MALKIIKATDPIRKEHLIVAIVGVPGSRKTTLGFTTHRPLNFDFDEAIIRAGVFRDDAAKAERWSDVASMTAEDLQGFDTAIIDTLGRAVEKFGLDVMAKDPKMSAGPGTPSQSGWGRIGSGFVNWVKLLRSFQKDIVILCHMQETPKGDKTEKRILCGGNIAKNEVYMVSDMIGELAYVGDKLFLNFSPADAWSKNPAQFPPIEVPASLPKDFLAKIIDDAKAYLNRMSEDQIVVSAALVEWNEMVQKATTPDALNKLLPALDHIDSRAVAAAKAILWKHAKEHGMTYDKDRKAFTEKAEPEVQGAPC